MKVLVCSHGFPEAARRLRALIPEHDVAVCAAEEVDRAAADADVLVPTMTRLGADLMARHRFGLIQQFGVGLEGVDVDAATQAGVWVARVPSAGTGNAESVAEHAVFLMLALSRQYPQAWESLQAKAWGQPAGMALLGKTACIVGLGDIGTALAVRLRPFGLHLTAVRKRPEHGAGDETGVARVYGTDALKHAVKDADYVIVCVKYDAQTHHLIDADVLAAMKPGAFLINIARGGLVDPEALTRALESGHLAGAGLDVFWEEPVDPDHPLFRQNVIATPHVAGVTDASYGTIAQVVAENVRRYAAGKALLHTVNKPSVPRAPVFPVPAERSGEILTFSHRQSGADGAYCVNDGAREHPGGDPA
jgi:phosphoglycerate dehydrogenase-like enzyme